MSNITKSSSNTNTANKIRYEVISSYLIRCKITEEANPPEGFTTTVSNALINGAQLAGGITSTVIYRGNYDTHVQFHQAVVYYS